MLFENTDLKFLHERQEDLLKRNDDLNNHIKKFLKAYKEIFKSI